MINSIGAIVLRIGDRLVSFSTDLTIFIVIGNGPPQPRHATIQSRLYTTAAYVPSEFMVINGQDSIVYRFATDWHGGRTLFTLSMGIPSIHNIIYTHMYLGHITSTPPMVELHWQWHNRHSLSFTQNQDQGDWGWNRFAGVDLIITTIMHNTISNKYFVLNENNRWYLFCCF